MKPAVAAVVLTLGVATGAVAAEIPGRLFYTPGQRAMLDAARQQNVRIDLGAGEEQEPTGPQEVTVNGVIRRSDGKSTVWVNNRMVGETGGAPGVEVRPRRDASGVTLSIPQTSRSVDLKVGQTIDVNTGNVAEPYRRRPAPAPAEKPAPKSPEAGKSAEKVTPAAAATRSSDRRRAKSDDGPPAEGLESNRNEKPAENPVQ